MKIIGVIIIFIALLIFTLTLVTEKLRENLKLILPLVTAFGFIGYGTLIYERVSEFPIPWLGTIKTIPQQTLDDAELVRETRDTVLAQSHTIGLVVQQASELSTKISNFESFLKISEEKINSSIEAVTKRLSDTQQKLSDAEQELKNIRERQQALQPRTLSEAQREQFLAILNRGPKGAVDIAAVMGDSEAHGFAAELDHLLKAAGWTTEGVSQAIFTGRLVGIELRIHNSNSIPSHFLVLAHAFDVIGVEIQRTYNPNDVPEGAVRLTIGHKP